MTFGLRTAVAKALAARVDTKANFMVLMVMELLDNLVWKQFVPSYTTVSSCFYATEMWMGWEMAFSGRVCISGVKGSLDVSFAGTKGRAKYLDGSLVR